MNKHYKVLHIIDSLGLGGAQVVVKGVFESQPTNKNIFLFALRKRKITTEIKHSNVEIFNSTSKYSLKPVFELWDLIRKEKIDILHCHLFKSQVFGWLLKKVWFKNIKLIFHEHGEIFQNHLVYNLFMKETIGSADLTVAVSKITKDMLIKKTSISDKKVVVLPNFIDLDRFNSKNITWSVKKEKEKLGIKSGEFVIGFVGRLAKEKGCEYLIKALPSLDFPYKILIAGEGSEVDRLKVMTCNLGVSGSVIFLGYREDVVYIYSLLDLLVVPSLSESFGLSVIEAQSANIPVLASDTGGLREVIKSGENGILFKTMDFFVLAEKIKLIKNDVRLTKGIMQRARESVKKYNSSYYSNLNKIYEKSENTMNKVNRCIKIVSICKKQIKGGL